MTRLIACALIVLATGLISGCGDDDERTVTVTGPSRSSALKAFRAEAQRSITPQNAEAELAKLEAEIEADTEPVDLPQL